MHKPAQLSDLQVDVAGIFFALAESSDYLVSGGAALLAADLIARPTEDLDLFAATPTTTVTPAKDAFVKALQARDYTVAMVQDGPTFCRMVVRLASDETLVDLAIDSPPHSRAALTVLGPTLAPLELAARKLLALFGRAEARDFADVYVLAHHFGKNAIINMARNIDPGFEPGVLAQMIQTMDRFEDSEIPLPPVKLPPARSFFAHWAQELQ